LAFIPYALIQGQGRPDLTAKLHVAEVVPFLAILYFLVTHFGLPGAALAWTFRTVADCLLMLRVGRCWTNYLGRMLPAVGLVAGSWIAAQFVPPTWISSIAAAALIGLAFVVLGFAMDATLRDGARAALAAGRRRWPGASAQNPG
jgi:O-antigen/teichoic acid export membrane protein